MGFGQRDAVFYFIQRHLLGGREFIKGKEEEDSILALCRSRSIYQVFGGHAFC
jgi:hypothetical protein